MVISVPASLGCISTYVLLEQENWFERELGFLLRWFGLGMNAIDIGANVGVYCLPLAHATGTGRVYAFEPGSTTRSHLEASRGLNRLDNLEISACALSDGEKQGRMNAGWSGELSALFERGAEPGSGESVRVSSLDVLQREYGWGEIDFVKIDAEGQEDRIVAGGSAFFRQQSPLVMHEVKANGRQSHQVRRLFEELGYHSYRLLGDASCLVPVGADEEFDAYELNIFGAKPDRAASLAARGLLVEDAATHSLMAEERATSLADFLALPYARAFEFSIADIEQCPYGEALIAHAAYRFGGLSAPRRLAALHHAFDTIGGHCAASHAPTALATYVRIALDLGHRQRAIDAMMKLVRVTGVEVDQPFLPACERYEGLEPAGRESEWFVAGANEQFELSRSLSSCFLRNESTRLKWLLAGPFSSPAICRRLILDAVVHGHEADLPASVDPRHGHCNPEYWMTTGYSALKALLRPSGAA